MNLKKIIEKYDLDLKGKLEKSEGYREKIVNKLFEEGTIESFKKLETEDKNILELKDKLESLHIYEASNIAIEVRNELNTVADKLLHEFRIDEVEELVKDYKILDSLINEKNKIVDIGEIDEDEDEEDIEVDEDTKVMKAEIQEIEEILLKEAEKEVNKRIENEREIGEYKYPNIETYGEVLKITGINIKPYKNGERAVYINKNGAIVIGAYNAVDDSIRIIKNSLIPKANIFNNKKEYIEELFQELRENECIESSDKYFKVVRDIENIDVEKITEFIVGEEVDYTEEWKNHVNRILRNFEN